MRERDFEGVGVDNPGIGHLGHLGFQTISPGVGKHPIDGKLCSVRCESVAVGEANALAKVKHILRAVLRHLP